MNRKIANARRPRASSQRLVVVLGVHRSGSSMLMRMLELLGVELGEHLGGAAADNPRGFWEDQEIKALNEEILTTLGMRWDSLRPIELTELNQRPEISPLKRQAAVLIKQRLAAHKTWGFKDPRTARLWPFWMDVFHRIGVTPNVVVTLRHPSSVALSLSRRNAMPVEQAYLLWLEHTLPAITLDTSVPHVVVDYDRVLKQPRRELQRVARTFGLASQKLDSQAGRQLIKDFIDTGLRHANFKPSEINADPAVTELVSKVYDAAYKLASDQPCDKRELTALAQRVLAFMAESGPLLHAYDRVYRQAQELPILEQRLGDAEGRISALNAAVEIRDTEIRRMQTAVDRVSNLTHELNSTIGVRDKDIRLLQGIVEQASGSIKELNEAMRFRDADLRQLRDSVAVRDADLTARDTEILRLGAVVARASEDIRELGAEAASQASYAIELQSKLKHERYTLLRPVLRQAYRALLSIGRRLPVGIKLSLQRLASRWLPSYRRRAIVYQYGPVATVGSSLERSSMLLQRAIAAGDSPITVLVFPVIDWYFRVQRPQHLAAELGKLGHRVIYFTTTFGKDDAGSAFELLDNPAQNVFIYRLNLSRPPVSIYQEVPDKDMVEGFVAALEQLRHALNIRSTVAIVNLPFWRRVVERLQGAVLVYDCMDFHAGFSTNATVMLAEEEALIRDADLVVTTSGPLSKIVGELRENVIIRNGADVQHFSRVPASLSLEKTRPIVGYFGAISEWFDFKLLLAVAKMRPQWDFILIGSTFGCEHIPAVLPANVQLLGEKPYTELPGYLHAFDVCLVPFKVVELTRCTNPVKVYEYLSAGKPVVATALPEVLAMDGMVRTASSPDEFVAALDQAMLEREDAGLAERRQGWAVEHSWAHRVTRLDSEVSRLYPKVSVVVLTYNNLDLTKSCLESIERFGCYPNMELVIVDNASSDATAEFLRSYAENRPGVRVILNQHNLGFAAGNNVGLSAASGEYLIVLNNDTYVTPGWIEGILRHFRQQPELGLVGPVTNNIGNEARVDVRYPDMAGMLKAARHYTAKHARERLYVDNVAFFCAAMPRTVWEIVGPLEEAFGVGFFEDDDYCNRVRQAGFKIAIADDVFVHHHLSASFNKLGDEVKRQLFERNKRIYEKKWGPWKPHRYRQAANES